MTRSGCGLCAVTDMKDSCPQASSILWTLFRNNVSKTQTNINSYSMMKYFQNISTLVPGPGTAPCPVYQLLLHQLHSPAQEDQDHPHCLQASVSSPTTLGPASAPATTFLLLHQPTRTMEEPETSDTVELSLLCCTITR